ncbi:MAG TPA: hypothetical protein DCZ92_01525 [Elusimicrobia bacterium]|nr:MAG: hypothetical protein A2016_12390 [Elusimicrobia bacterium GWF2_62_30]HBA59506.1 hypothetical protein [Elusimicrobiota bacterium]
MTESRIKSVLMVGQTFYPVLGGAEKQAFELSKALVNRGVKVSVITRRVDGLPAREVISGVKVERFGVFGSGALDSLVFMFKVFFYMLAHAAEYDVAHVHLASSPAVAALLAGRFTGKRTVVKLGRGQGLDEISLSGKTFLGRLKLKFFSVFHPEVLVLSSEAYNWLKNSREFTGLRPRLFRNGVDTGRYTPPLYHEKISAKAAVGLENDIVFLSVGRLVREKRLREFVELWAEVLAEEMTKPKMRLVIVGSGPEEASLKNAVEKLGVGASVLLAGPKGDLLPYYRAADVFVLPSLTEGMSNSMLEAMACGVAIMASRVDGAKDAVVEGESGCLFDPLNPAEIKACLRRYIAERSIAGKMGEQARKTAVEKYSMARVADEVLKIYEGE